MEANAFFIRITQEGWYATKNQPSNQPIFYHLRYNTQKLFTLSPSSGGW